MSTEQAAPGPAACLVIAHRGASAAAPENTIAAFELAVTQEADGIELDVHLSADGHPVVIHDDSLERTTDGAGPVAARTMRELKRLDAGGWYGPSFRGQRIQTLQEVLERFKGRARFWIELKGGSDLYPGIEERVVSMVEIYDVVDLALIQSFDHAALARCRGFNREIALGALVEAPPFSAQAPATGMVQAVCPAAEALTEAAVRSVRTSGLACYAWTVNEPAQMDRLVEWGITGIITDRPELLRARLGR
jgi:glycerophosphoryl diester phosphodiesterase